MHSKLNYMIIRIKVIILAVAIIIALGLSSCTITRSNNGFHIGRAIRNDGGGGCGSWHSGGSFRRR